MTAYAINAYWPRFHVSYLQAVGALRVLSEQLDPAVRCRFELGAHHKGDQHAPSAYQFSLGADAVNTFWRETYTPSAIYSPWNARAFGTGFGRSLAAARKVPQLAPYVAVIDAAGDVVGDGPPAKKGAGRGKRSPKVMLLEQLVSGEVALSPSHTRWVRACWRLDLPTTKRGKPKVHARPLTGAGGCEASMDYGSLFLRAAVDWFTGARAPVSYSLGGFAFPDTSAIDWGFTPPNGGWTHWPDPLAVLLLLEGACAFGAPWLEHTDGTMRDAWLVPGRDRGCLWLPLWDGERTWEEVRQLLAAGWVRRSNVATEISIVPDGVSHLIPVRWRPDAKLMRMVCSTSLQTARHIVRAELRLVHSPDEGDLWYAALVEDVPTMQDFAGVTADQRLSSWESDLGDRDEVRQEALDEARRMWGDALELTESTCAVEE